VRSISQPGQDFNHELHPEARCKVARALVESELDVHMAELILSLASKEPADTKETGSLRYYYS
jgi:hypothetical protein